MSAPAARVAYVLKGFPRSSETFIAQELERLTELGLDILPFSIKAAEPVPIDPALPPIRYLPATASLSGESLIAWLCAHLPVFAADQCYWWRRSPLRYVGTLALAARFALRYRPPGRRLRKSLVREFLLATRVARLIREDGAVRHVHAHFCHDATTVAWFAARLCALPFSFTAHAKDIYQRRLNPGDLLDRKLTAARFVVTCTRANVAYLAARTADPAKVHGIYHGLDTTRFRPAPSDARTARPARLLSVGRLVEKKGHLHLLEACVTLRERGVDFELDIIGEDGGEGSRLRDFVEAQGLSAQVRFSPAMPHAALARRFTEATVFVLPCVILADGDRDGIPNVMAEAMACAVPVVVTGVSGIPELVVDDETGLLVPERDARAIADAVQRLIDSPTIAARIGAAARACIERRFDAARTHRELFALFVSALEPAGESAPRSAAVGTAVPAATAPDSSVSDGRGALRA